MVEARQKVSGDALRAFGRWFCLFCDALAAVGFWASSHCCGLCGCLFPHVATVVRHVYLMLDLVCSTMHLRYPVAHARSGHTSKTLVTMVAECLWQYA